MYNAVGQAGGTSDSVGQAVGMSGFVGQSVGTSDRVPDSLGLGSLPRIVPTHQETVRSLKRIEQWDIYRSSRSDHWKELVTSDSPNYSKKPLTVYIRV